MILLIIMTGQSDAQWKTESIALKSGWNAVFLNVDPSHESVQALVDKDINSPITQVWRWNAPSTGVFYSDPLEYTLAATGWRQWVLNDPDSDLKTLTGDTAYLVETIADYTWQIKGRPVVPRPKWNLNGLNLIGFPTAPLQSPTLESFLNAASDVQSSDFEIFKYSGADLNESNPQRIHPFLYRTETFRRGKAFWIRSGTVLNSYFGPIEVDLAGRDGLDYGVDNSAHRFRIRNKSGQPLNVTVELMSSESPPSGEAVIDGMTPLLVRGQLNPDTFEYGYSPLIVGSGNGLSWNLAEKDQEGSEVEVVLGLDRSAIVTGPGSHLAGLLKITDSLGLLEIWVPVEADVGSNAGLWVGEAQVTTVGQYLKTYARGAADPIIVTNGTQVITNDIVIAEDGSYTVESINTELTGVARPFPLRLIVHRPESGDPLLLQQVYFGPDIYSNMVVTRVQSVLDPERYDESRRITATHLPWSEENEGWMFDGPLDAGQAATAIITTDYDDQRSNPFLHTYHPDHDNLDSRFGQELTQGSESYKLVREITLDVQPPGTNFSDRIFAHQELIGEYRETFKVIGLPRAGGTNDTQIFETRGVFGISRVTDQPVITNPL